MEELYATSSASGVTVLDDLLFMAIETHAVEYDNDVGKPAQGPTTELNPTRNLLRSDS